MRVIGHLAYVHVLYYSDLFTCDTTQVLQTGLQWTIIQNVQFMLHGESIFFCVFSSYVDLCLLHRGTYMCTHLCKIQTYMYLCRFPHHCAVLLNNRMTDNHILLISAL